MRAFRRSRGVPAHGLLHGGASAVRTGQLDLRVKIDASAAEDGYVRIVDDSGESYLYPEAYFAAVDLPAAVERELRRADDGSPRRAGSRRR